jgi:hypothetical protein
MTTSTIATKPPLEDHPAFQSDGYIYTFTGRKVYPLALKEEDINIADIAHGLANSARWTGQSGKFYSVAQHSVLVADCLPANLAAWGLLHDADEAYLGDIARPVKYMPEMKALLDAGKRAQAVINRAFGLKGHTPRAVKEADDYVVVQEWVSVMGREGVCDLMITPQSPVQAEISFLQKYGQLFEAHR